MSTLEEIAAGEPCKNWAATRQELIDEIERHVKSEFDPVDQITDPLTQVSESSDEIKSSILSSLWDFQDPPFTVQRLAELGLHGPEIYGSKGLAKYYHALRRVLSVTSTENDFNDPELSQMLVIPADKGVVLEDISWAD